MNKLRHFYFGSLAQNITYMKVAPTKHQLPLSVQYSNNKLLFCDQHCRTYFPPCLKDQFRQKIIPVQQYSLLCSASKRTYAFHTSRTEFRKSTDVSELEDRGDKTNRDILEDLYEETVVQRHKIQSEGGWVIRLANENGYLSWCRNTYLATAVAVACFSQTDTVPYAPYAADVVFLMGGLNLIVGTITYVSQLVQLRDITFMSRVTILTHSSMAILHLLLWFTAAIVYLGYGEDDSIVIVTTDDPDHGMKKA